MSKVIRISILLVLLVAVAAFYFLRSEPHEPVTMHVARPAAVKPRPVEIKDIVSPEKHLLRSENFAELEATLAKYEASAAASAEAEYALHGAIDHLGHANDENMKRLERWAETDSHYAQLALARAYRERGFLQRGTDYANKIDPLRLERFRELTSQSFRRAEQAAKLHPECGVAYSLMIEALVGISRREQIDAVFKRSQKAAPQWHGPLLSYFYALHPNWHGRTGERQRFVEDFERRNPGHRAIALMQSSEYSRLARVAIEAHKYGEAMILADLAIENNPKNSSAWENKGRAFEGVQRSQDALRAMGKAIDLNVYSDSAYRHRGDLRLRMGMPEGQDDLVRAALLGDVWALQQSLWNWISGNTVGVTKDWSRVPDLCERSRATGLPDGIFCVATVYFFGYGLPQDVKKGFEIMKEAADNGVSDAMSDVGKIYWMGKPAAGVTQDKEKAVRYWMRAAAIGNDRALVELSQVKNDPDIKVLVEKIRKELPPSSLAL